MKMAKLRRRLRVLIDRGLKTTKTETVYTEILTPPDQGDVRFANPFPDISLNQSARSDPNERPTARS
jgi:hypothetical protein